MIDKRGTRVKSMGEKTISKMAKELAVQLGKDSKNCAAKYFRMSVAAQLAESGMSVASVQMAGDWKGVATQLEHVEYFSESCNGSMSMLDREEEEFPKTTKNLLLTKLTEEEED